MLERVVDETGVGPQQPKRPPTDQLHAQADYSPRCLLLEIRAKL